MSSLAASRADNFYFPPDWRPEYGGISKFQGSKGANQYQQYGILPINLQLFQSKQKQDIVYDSTMFPVYTQIVQMEAFTSIM